MSCARSSSSASTTSWCAAATWAEPRRPAGGRRPTAARPAAGGRCGQPARGTVRRGRGSPATPNAPPSWASFRSTGSVLDLAVARGRFLGSLDRGAHAPVCVLGARLGRRLFGRQDPVGRQVRLDGTWCEVAGVLVQRSTGERSGGRIAAARDLDGVAIGPLSAVLPASPATDPTQRIDEVWIRLAGGTDVAARRRFDRAHARPGSRRPACARNRRAAGSTEPACSHAEHLQCGGGQRRSAVAPGRRHRHHERHAHVGARTDPRDRPAARRRRDTPRHRGAVLDREPDHDAGRRRARSRGGRRHVARHHCLRCLEHPRVVALHRTCVRRPRRSWGSRSASIRRRRRLRLQPVDAVRYE